MTKPDVPEQENVLPFASGTGVGPKGRPIPTDPDPAPAGDHAGAGERDGEPGISVDDFVRFMAAQPDPPADESEEALHERMREQEPALRAAERAIARRAQRTRDIYTFEALSPNWKGE